MAVRLDFLLRGGEAVSVYEALMVMIAFATLIYYITKDTKK